MADKNMTLSDHLNELRRRLIYVFVFFILSTACALFFTNRIYRFLIRDVGGDKLAVLGPSDIIWIYFLIAGVAAIALTLPFAAWQAWRFVAPALTARERAITLAYIPAIFFLFAGGIAFGYFVVFPNIFQFLLTINDGMFTLVLTADRYFRFMINIVLPFGFLFELPVLVVFLTNLGIITPTFMRKKRRIAYFLLIVLAVILSPPDFVSDAVMSVPLLLLYELSITFSAMASRRRQKRMRAEADKLTVDS